MLEKVELMLSVIANEISFVSRPADELIDELAKRQELSQLKFIPTCREYISGGCDFKAAWQNSLKRPENVRFLKKSDVLLLISFAEGFGVTDSDGQLSNCSLHRNFLRDNINDAKLQRDKYSKMSSGLGLLCGIGVVVVFI